MGHVRIPGDRDAAHELRAVVDARTSDGLMPIDMTQQAIRDEPRRY